MVFLLTSALMLTSACLIFFADRANQCKRPHTAPTTLDYTREKISLFRQKGEEYLFVASSRGDLSIFFVAAFSVQYVHVYACVFGFYDDG